MLDTETLAVELKSSTADLHRNAESRPLQKLMAAGELPREAYGRYLGQLFHVHAALEAALRRTAGAHVAIGTVWSETRAHARRLQSDLEALGMTSDDVRIGPATRTLLDALERTAEENPVALIGAFYVLEGSMNGNRFLARALGRAYDLSPGAGLSYLDPYGESQPARWLDFKQSLDGLTLDQPDRDAIVAWAGMMFRSIGSISDEALIPLD